jgi:hypothetical protein
LLLLDDAAMPPTHHASAPAIRLSTVLRQVTNGFRSEWGRDLLAAVRAVVNTGKRHGLAASQAIQKALAPLGSLFEPGGVITIIVPLRPKLAEHFLRGEIQIDLGGGEPVVA